jgi:hypothetical protein
VDSTWCKKSLLVYSKLNGSRIAMQKSLRIRGSEYKCQCGTNRYRLNITPKVLQLRNLSCRQLHATHQHRINGGLGSRRPSCPPRVHLRCNPKCDEQSYHKYGDMPCFEAPFSDTECSCGSRCLLQCVAENIEMISCGRGVITGWKEGRTIGWWRRGV